ncbi:MAG: LTA synthase family protein [Bdellovibrionales bacterium]
MTTFYPWALLARRLALILAVYFTYRMLFFVLNSDVYAVETFSTIFLAFVQGIRFDLWALTWTHAPVILLSFAPWRWQAHWLWQRLVLVYVLAVNFWCFGLNAIDLELYKFTGKRLTTDWLKLQQDMQNQTMGLVSYYWWVALLGFVTWLVFWRFWPRWKLIAPRPGAWARALVGLVFVVLTALSMRGGWQLKPLNLADAYSSGSSAVGILRMNSTFTFFRSRSSFDSLALRFFKGNEPARETLLAESRGGPSPLDGKFKGYNIVVLIIESLASEYVGVLNEGKGYTPFLDELTAVSTLFRNNFANGRRSIEAVPSVVCGLPSLMGEALILSPYQGIDLHCLPEVARRAGYATHFFHGAYNGSMHFDAFSNRAGFNKFYGFNEYGDSADSDGHWGIFDEPMLNFTVKTLNQSVQPFAAVMFTLSSHSPYRLPPGLEGRFPKGELEIHPSIGYVDYALKQFFAQAQKSKWFKNTIFVITGDHTQKSVQRRYQSLTGLYRVPLWFYIPGKKLGGDPMKFTQHLDILPTLMTLAGLPLEPRLKIGQNVFAPGAGVVFNGDERGFWSLGEAGLIEYNRATTSFARMAFDPKTWLTSEAQNIGPDDAVGHAAEQLKAIVDYHNEGVVQNRLYK